MLTVDKITQHTNRKFRTCTHTKIFPLPQIVVVGYVRTVCTVLLIVSS